MVPWLLVDPKTLEIKAWREYEFEFSRLPIAITNRANIRILKVNIKKNHKIKFKSQNPKAWKEKLKHEIPHHDVNREASRGHWELFGL